MPFVRILHISDLHNPGTRDSANEWQRTLLLEAWKRDLVELVDPERPIDLICFTGDIADWGKPEEYRQITELLDAALQVFGLSRDRVFPIPGNHDIDRNINREVWEEIREKSSQVDYWKFSSWMCGGKPPLGLPADLRDAVLQRQSAFWDWVKNDLGRPELLPSASPHGFLGYRATVSLPKLKFPIHIIGFDSAWLAGDNYDATRLYLTFDQVGRLVHSDGRALPGLRIGLVHHPLTDFADTGHWKQILSDRIDLLLRGHIHAGGLIEEVEPGRKLRHVAAGCLYEHPSWPNSFNVLEIETDEQGQALSIEVRFRKWSLGGTHWHDDNGLYKGAKDGRYRWNLREGGEEVDAALKNALKMTPEHVIITLTDCLERLGPRLANTDRVRLLANLASAHEARGDMANASKTYEQVAEISPSAEDGEAFRALALLHRKEHAAVIKASDRVLAIAPEHELMQVASIHASDLSIPFEKVYSKIPESLLTKGNILYALGWRAFQALELDLALDFAKRGDATDHTGSRFIELRASVCLKRFEVLRQRDPTDPGTREREELAEMEPILEAALARNLGPTSRSTILYLRAEMLWRLGRLDDAEESLSALSMPGVPVDLEHIERHSDLLIEMKRPDKAEKLILRHLKSSPSLALILRLANAREAKDTAATAGTGGWADICNRIREFLVTQPPPKLELALDAIGFLIRNDLELDPVQVRMFASTLGEPLRDALYCLALQRRGAPAETVSLANGLHDGLSAESSLEELIFVAQALAGTEASNERRAAIQIWVDKLLPRPDLGDRLFLGLEFATRLNDDRFTLRVCRRLRECKIETPGSLDLEIALLSRLGDYEQVLTLIDFACARFASIERFVWGMTLRRCHLAILLRRPELIERNVSYLIGDGNYPLETASTVATILHQIEPLTAIEFLYQRVRKTPDDAGTARLFADAVGPGAVDIPSFEAVAADAAVLVEMPTSSVWIVIETGPDASPGKDEFPPDHPSAKSLMGHAVGDTCSIGGGEGASSCVIRLITSKYLYLQRKIWDRWGVQHPDQRYVRFIDLERDEAGNLDMDKFSKVLDDLGPEQSDFESLVANPVVSPSLLAKARRTNVLGGFAMFQGTKGGFIRQTASTWARWNESYLSLDASTEIMVDPLTLAMLIDSEVLPQFGSVSERLAVAQDALDEWRALVLKDDRSERSFAKKVGDHYEYYRYNHEAWMQAKSKIEKALDWIEDNCTVLDGAHVLGLSDDVREDLARLFPASVVQSIAAASETGRVLWTDDFAIVTFLDFKLPLPHVASPVVTKRYHALRLIDDAALSRLLSHMLTAGVEGVDIDTGVFVESAGKLGWDVAKLTKLFHCVVASRATTKDLASVSATILDLASRQIESRETRMIFFNGYISALAHRHDGSFVLHELEMLCLAGRFGYNIVAETNVVAEIAKHQSKQ